MRSDCEQCSGTGWIVRPVQTGAARAVAERCSCVVEKAERQRFFQARIPRKFSIADFDTFRTDELSLHKAKEACQKLVARYPVARRGLLLMGSSGIGKTHLATATLRGLLQKGADGIFYDFRDLLDELRASYGPEAGRSEESILHRVFTVEVLVLDELGSEKLTDWVREIVHRVVIRRYNDERLTICTTNYLDTELLGREADPLETLEGRIGYRLRSRLYEMCDTLVLGGKDYRRQEEGLERMRSAPPPQEEAAARAEAQAEADGEISLEQCELALRKMPPPLRQPWLDEARKQFISPMHAPHLLEKKAAELYREHLRNQGRKRRAGAEGLKHLRSQRGSVAADP
jgi:DNA replication protein DnaC